MRIELVGTVATSKVNKVIKDIVSEVLEKAELPQDVKYKVKDLTCNIAFMIDGQEQALTVEHDGVPEMFTIKTALDKKGNIEKSVNNSKASFLDNYTRATLKGEEIDYSKMEEITSPYTANELEELSVLAVEDKKEIVYRHIEKNIYILRYYVGERLMGELETNKIPDEHLKNMM